MHGQARVMPPVHHPPRIRLRRLRGTAMAEFTVVALPLLLVGLGAFETGRWLLVRQAVGYALFEAARAGVVSHADPSAMAGAFERALAPALGIDALPDPASVGPRVKAKLQAREREYGLPMARIEQLSPNRASFDDFSNDRSSAGGVRELDYDYQRLHHDTVYLARYGNGAGPHSRQTVFQANTLVLRLTYLHAPYLPWMAVLLRTLADPGEEDDYVRRARAAGLVVIRRDIAMPMQSAAREHAKNENLLAG